MKVEKLTNEQLIMRTLAILLEDSLNTKFGYYGDRDLLSELEKRGKT